ncbi:MAG: dynamin family protein [Ruegeria sp.]|uniref:dynamin family protein n=1 Tax=Ruegeria sp. TaxID=1879320 RepID=UPI00349E7D2B
MNTMSLAEKPKRRAVTPAQMDRLTRWARRKPVVALMGEFSAGKSTLLNFMLERDVLPTRVTATELPPVWLSYGQGDAYRVGRDGTRSDVDLNAIDAIPIAETRFIRVFSDAAILKFCDLMDMPGISDPNLARDHWIEAVGYASFVVWCTHATQAWRSSEKSLWSSLPPRLKRNSILAVTRADKLTTPLDRSKVARRVQRETEGLFGHAIMLSARNAQRARETAGETSEAWRKSGGAQFFQSLNSSIYSAVQHRLDLLGRYECRAEPQKPATLSVVDSQEKVVPRRVDGALKRRATRPSEAETEALLALTQQAVEGTFAESRSIDQASASSQKSSLAKSPDDILADKLFAKISNLRNRPLPRARRVAGKENPDARADARHNPHPGVSEAGAEEESVQDRIAMGASSAKENSVGPTNHALHANSVHRIRSVVQAERSNIPGTGELAQIVDRFLYELAGISDASLGQNPVSHPPAGAGC